MGINMGGASQIPPEPKEDTIDHAVNVLSHAFTKDAYLRYTLVDLLKLDNSAAITPQIAKPFFTELVSSLKAEGARITTALGTVSTNIWQVREVPRGSNGQAHHAVDEDMPKAVQELHALSDHALDRALPNHDEFLHWVISANIRDKEGGLTMTAPEVARPVLSWANSNNLPVWAEGTSPLSRDIMISIGFEFIEELRLGVGHIDSEGKVKEGGEGVSLWAVVLRPGNLSYDIPRRGARL